MENRQAQIGADGGQDSALSLDLYSLAGVAAVAVAAGLMGLLLARDEHALHRKRSLIPK
ncbi:MAG TPA: hypothetical protein VIE86_00445 [Nitrososphaera sp.]|jgi:hypothetical protein